MTSRPVPQDIKALAHVLDKQFKGPFNIRFGLDSVIGILPFWGDLASLVLSHYVLIRSVLLRCPSSILIRMVINTYIDFVFGCIPFLGDLFDLYWKANIKNTALLEKYLSSPKKTQNASRLSILLLILALIVFFIMSVYSLIKLYQFLISQL